MPWLQRHWVWWQEGRCRLLFEQRWRCTPETSLSRLGKGSATKSDELLENCQRGGSLSRLTCWQQLVVRIFARGLEATTCPLNMKKANMFPISPDTWSTSQFIQEPCFQDTVIIHSWCSWNTFWKQAKPGASPKQCRSSCLLSQGRCIWPRNFPASFKLYSFATF